MILYDPVIRTEGIAPDPFKTLISLTIQLNHSDTEDNFSVAIKRR